MLKHHRIHMNKVWVDGRAVQGIKTTWQCDDAQLQALLDMVAPSTAAPGKTKLVAVGGKKK